MTVGLLELAELVSIEQEKPYLTAASDSRKVEQILVRTITMSKPGKDTGFPDQRKTEQIDTTGASLPQWKLTRAAERNTGQR